MFSIRFDKLTGILTAQLEGYWDLPTYKDYEAELLQISSEIRQRHGRFKMLVDARRFPVQSAEVSNAFQCDFAEFADTQASVIAMVLGSILNKQQVKRVFPYPNVHVFWNVEDAHQWLLEEARPASQGEPSESIRPH